MDAPSQPGGPPRRPRFLVTAGNTRERIDAVRDWGNVFTGTTGFEIAKALSAAGEVDLVTSNRSHLEWLLHASPAGAGPVRGTAFTTHEELKVALAAQMGRGPCDAVFMTAAVADYRPERVFEVLQRRPDPAGGQGVETWTVRDVQAGKVKSHFGQIAVLGGRTEKLVDLFRTAWGHRGLLVKFKLEVGIARDELLRVAEASRRASNADYLVANTLDMVQGPGAGAYLLGEGSHEWVPRPDLPARMLGLARSALARPTPGRT
jgi:phosphopantothenate---cysteine ligase (CTP)